MLSEGGSAKSRSSAAEASLPLTMTRERRSYCVYIMGSLSGNLSGNLSGTLYIGFTGNLHRRVFQHKFHQMEGFTNRYDVERLLYWASFDDVHKAIGREKQLKGWSRKKKIALIESRNPDWLDLAKDWYPWMKKNGETQVAAQC
jgi:putative endonuclease